uniref:Uncharacterized protein n=1 Tax=Lactuca sativa TaxID=4236 RepID=A0A9R1V2H2_LACSA|nr:hypothetical protein LSAT_V11C700373030 [Lactuca sativa]
MRSFLLLMWVFLTIYWWSFYYLKVYFAFLRYILFVLILHAWSRERIFRECETGVLLGTESYTGSTSKLKGGLDIGSLELYGVNVMKSIHGRDGGLGWSTDSGLQRSVWHKIVETTTNKSVS